jgi:uncharacterized DUF497 family protein
MIDFEWDPSKAQINTKKHNVGFIEATSVFNDPLGITIFDPDHSNHEERFITIGKSDRNRILMVAHTDRGNKTRIINARELTRTEYKDYESEIKKRRKR